MRLSPAGAMILVAFSIPVAIELRTLFALFGVDLPLAAVAVFEVVMLAAIFALLRLSRGADEDDDGDGDGRTAASR
jgi:hypothetical protein